MNTRGRRTAALVGLLGTMAVMLCVTAAGYADTVKTDTDLTTEDVETRVNPLGATIADAVRSAAHADAAFVAASYFASHVHIARGDTTTAQILNTLEFKGDEISVVRLTGSQITRALEHGLSLYPRANGAFLQFSGLTVVLNSETEKEKRSLSVKIDGSVLDPNRTYRVAMPAPLANGALAYFKFWAKKDIDDSASGQNTMESAITDYLRAHSNITKGDERLVDKNR